MAGRDGEFRKGIGYLVELEGTALGELHGAADYFGSVGEELFHLRRALYVELVGIELEALGIVDGVRGLYAEQDFVGVVVVFAEVVAVVGGYQRDVELFFEAEEIGVDFLFQFQALVLNFEKEVAAAEDVLIAGRRSLWRLRTFRPSGWRRLLRPGSRRSRSGPRRVWRGSFC